jgi:hypothetical protein
MKEQPLIEALRALAQNALDYPTEPGRSPRFNVSFEVGKVQVKVSCTADHMVFRMEMEAQYWKNNNATSVNIKTGYGKTRGKMAGPDDGTTAMGALDSFFEEVAAINEQLVDPIEGKVP